MVQRRRILPGIANSLASLFATFSAVNAQQQPPPAEPRIVRSIRFLGMDPLQVSEIQARFKERSVGVVIEQRHDPEQVARGVAVLEELLAERGRKGVKVETETREIPPRSLEVTFRAKSD